MDTLDIFGFCVRVDEEVTRRWYAGYREWGCDCGDCRNFLALARERTLPEPVLAVLDGLNIPPEKATYVCEMYPNKGGHCYQFSYRIAGQILEPAEVKTFDWGQGLCGHEIYPYGAPDFPAPHFDLEFWVTLPWVLDGKNA